VREAEPIHKIVTPELLSIVDRRHRRRRRWPWVAAAAAVLLVPGLALLLDMQAGSPPGDQRNGSPTGSAPSGAPASVTPVTAAAGVLACTVPAPEREQIVPAQVPLLPGEKMDLAGGFVWHRENNGLRIAAAPGWGWSYVDSSLLCFRERDGARAISVQRLDRPAGNLATAWDVLEAPWRAAANMADYRRIKVVLGPFWEGSADLEYTFNGTNGAPMHGRSMLVATSSRTAYIISFLAKEIDWTALATQYLMVVGSFWPADEST
jgi:hypothetical protein